MDTEKLNTMLYEKMAAEQDKYRDWLKSQPPEEILNHTCEYTVREDIVMEMEALELTAEQAKALLASPSPLADVYRRFEKMDTGHMDYVRDCIELRADAVIQQERDRLRNAPVYLHSGAYAREHNELDQFRASFRANIACKEAIEQGIRENYADNRLNGAAVYKAVTEKFGPERVNLVLANTVRHMDWDERFSRENKQWAQTIPMEASHGDRDNDHSLSYVIGKVHPGIADLFVTRARKEQAREQEQPQKGSVLEKLHRPLAAASPKQDKAKRHER